MNLLAQFIVRRSARRQGLAAMSAAELSVLRRPNDRLRRRRVVNRGMELLAWLAAALAVALLGILVWSVASAARAS